MSALEQSDAPPQGPTLAARLFARRGLLAVLALHAMALVVVAGALPGPDGAEGSELYVAFALGCIYAQLGLLSIWIVFSGRPLVQRVPLAAFAWVLISLAMTYYVIRTDGPATIGFVAAGMFLAQSALIQAPLWVARLKGRWRLACGEAESAEQAAQAQFSIAQMMLWTAGVAIVLGVARYVFRDVRGDDASRWLAVFGLFMVFNVLLAAPAIWLSFLRCAPPKWWVGLGVGLTMLTLAEWIAFSGVRREIDIELPFFVLMNAVHLGGLIGSLLVCRRQGWMWRPPQVA